MFFADKIDWHYHGYERILNSHAREAENLPMQQKVQNWIAKIENGEHRPSENRWQDNVQESYSKNIEMQVEKSHRNEGIKDFVGAWSLSDFSKVRFYPKGCNLDER